MPDPKRNDPNRADHLEHDKIPGIGSHEEPPRTAGNDTSEIATNDGSVIETLDTAFHGKPGWSEGENLSGSNRADYYEARSQGKSDSEEELAELQKSNSQDLNK